MYKLFSVGWTEIGSKPDLVHGLSFAGLQDRMSRNRPQKYSQLISTKVQGEFQKERIVFSEVVLAPLEIHKQNKNKNTLT